MTDKTPAGEVLCPVALTLSLIGGKWKALILWNLLEGTMRYSALRKAVPDATPKMLTQQLRELEADGLVSRTVWPVVPPRVDYALTPTGESIKPILTAIVNFQRFSTLDARKLVNGPKMSAHHRGICHF